MCYSLEFTGPSRDQGTGDNKWYWRYSFGNGNIVLASGEIGGEDAPIFKTALTLTDEGIYDIWFDFWANPDYNWRIKAGLAEDNMKVFGQMVCKHVEAGDHHSTITISGDGNTFLYQAYVSRVQTSSNDTLNVFVDDETIQNGISNTLIGDAARTWYDGISYAILDTGNIVSVHQQADIEILVEFSPGQNYPNLFNATTTITCSLPYNDYITLKVYNLIGQEVATLADKVMFAGTHRVIWNDQKSPSGVYFIKITAGNYSQIKKILMLR